MMKVVKLSICVFLLVSISILSQDFRTPRPSLDATVSQFVGVTEITIDYSRPGVKERTIWGELVPFGKIWRTGANEVTSITFSTPVEINGNKLDAGTYGIHTIPGEAEWEFIFSKNTKVDDPMNYDEAKDALRLKLKPETAPFTERMMFTITDMSDNTAKINLIWEKLKISFDVSVSTQELVLQSARKSADWGMLMSASNYCLQKNVNMDEGYRWIQASALINENYWNMRVKAQYLAKMNMKKDAISTMEKAIDLGSKMDNPPFDFDTMKKMLEDWKK